jgi:hypothetical protein
VSSAGPIRAYPEHRAFFLPVALLSSRPGLLPSLPLPTPDPLRSPSFPLRVPLPRERERDWERKRASCPGPCCFACDVLSVINCPHPFTQVTGSGPPSLPPSLLPPSLPLSLSLPEPPTRGLGHSTVVGRRPATGSATALRAPSRPGAGTRPPVLVTPAHYRAQASPSPGRGQPEGRERPSVVPMQSLTDLVTGRTGWLHDAACPAFKVLLRVVGLRLGARGARAAAAQAPSPTAGPRRGGRTLGQSLRARHSLSISHWQAAAGRRNLAAGAQAGPSLLPGTRAFESEAPGPACRCH